MLPSRYTCHAAIDVYYPPQGIGICEFLTLVGGKFYSPIHYQLSLDHRKICLIRGLLM